MPYVVVADGTSATVFRYGARRVPKATLKYSGQKHTLPAYVRKDYSPIASRTALLPSTPARALGSRWGSMRYTSLRQEERKTPGSSAIEATCAARSAVDQSFAACVSFATCIP